MASLMKSLGIDRLSREQQTQLAEELLEQLDARAMEYQLTAAQLDEIERRMAEHDADPSTAIPWEEVEAQALARLKK